MNPVHQDDGGCPGFRDDFIRDHLPLGASGQIISVCGRFGVAAVAGEFATALGITGWPAGEATKAAAACFRVWLDQRGSLGDHDIEAGIQQVIAFVEQFGGSRFEELRSAGEWEDAVSNRVGFRSFDHSTRTWSYYILPDVFKSEVAKGYPTQDIVAEMVKRGLILPAKDKKNSQVRRMGRAGPMRVYVLKPGIINTDEPEEAPLEPWYSREMKETPPPLFH
jgi:putative DNA primase/helicase